MVFDFVKDLVVPGRNGKKFEEADKLAEYCLTAERNVRTDPDNAIFNIRKALEVLVQGLLLEDGNTEFAEEEQTLYHMLKIYGRSCSCKFIKRKKKTSLDKIRKSINNTYMHIFVNSSGEEKYELVGEHADLHDAYNLLLSLKNCIQSIFDLEHTSIGLKDIPISDYQIVEVFPVKEYESVAGKYKYKCRKKTPVGPDTYAYVRPYNTEDSASEVFNMRDLETQNFFKNMKSSSHIIRGNEIHVAEYCDTHFMAYEIRENTKTLDEIIYDDLTAIEFIDIIKQAAEGLSDLITDRISIFHRNIRPTCIFVTPDDGKFVAQLGCFETAKISYTDSSMTITEEDLKKAQKNNTFVHEKLQGKPVGTTIQEWEAGDVYSLAAILVYCINKNAGKKNTKDCTILLDYFSEEFYDEMDQIIYSGSLEVIPSMKDFCAILNEEMIRLKNV